LNVVFYSSRRINVIVRPSIRRSPSVFIYVAVWEHYAMTILPQPLIHIWAPEPVWTWW